MSCPHQYNGDCGGCLGCTRDKVKQLELQIDELKRHWFTIRQAANSMEEIFSKLEQTEKRNDLVRGCSHVFDSYDNTDTNEMRIICRACGFIKLQ